MAELKVATQACVYCSNNGIIILDADAFYAWQSSTGGEGGHIQDFFPDLDDDQRELLLTGTHAHCWAALFPGDDDDDDD